MKARGPNYFDVGVQGRKTGLTLREGVRDEFGLELIDGIFSSPAPQLPKPTAAAPRNSHVQSEALRDSPAVNGQRATPDPLPLLGDRRTGRSSLPPRARSPIKTNLNSPPRKQPTKGPSPSPFQHINGPPSRGMPVPAAIVKRRLNFGMDDAVPSVEHLQSTPRGSRFPRAAHGSQARASVGTPHLDSYRTDFEDGLAQPAPSKPLEPTRRQEANKSVTMSSAAAQSLDIPAPRRNGTLIQHAPESMGDIEDHPMDDSIQLVQYGDDDGFEDGNGHEPALTSASQYESATTKAKMNPAKALQQDTTAPQATAFAVKKGQGQAPKPRTIKPRAPKSRALVYNELREVGLDEGENPRPRKRSRKSPDEAASASRQDSATQAMPSGKENELPERSKTEPWTRDEGRANNALEDPFSPDIVEGDSLQSGPAAGTEIQEADQPQHRWTQGTPEQPPKESLHEHGSPLFLDDDLSDDLQKEGDEEDDDSAQIDPRLLEISKAQRAAQMDRGSQQREESTVPEAQMQRPKAANASNNRKRRDASAAKSGQPTAAATSDAQTKRGRGRPRGSKNKPKVVKVPFDEELEPWEDEPGIINGPVKIWDEELGSSLDYLVEDEIAYSSRALDTLEVPNGAFRYAKPVTLPFFGSGLVEIPPGGIKRPKNSRSMQMVFFVFSGKVLVDISGNKFRIGKGGMWQVPRGNWYSIANDYDMPAKIFFAQGSEVMAGEGVDEAAG